MAFSYTLDGRTIFGDKWVAWGTFSNGDTDTGGDIDTGLSVVEAMFLQETGSAVVSNASVCNETFPVSGGVVTIVTDAGVDGLWFAIGRM